MSITIDPTKKATIDAAASSAATNASRVAAIKANARRQALVTAIQNSDDAQLLAYINNSVTDLASAKVALANLVLLVAAVVRA